jgi:hypothetical protein
LFPTLSPPRRKLKEAKPHHKSSNGFDFPHILANCEGFFASSGRGRSLSAHSHARSHLWLVFDGDAAAADSGHEGAQCD